MKLYPPHINGTIPAFYSVINNETGEKITKLTVPFTMNKTVNENSVGGFILLVKTAHSNKLLGSLKVEKLPGQVLDWDFTAGKVLFNIDPDSNIAKNIYIGNHYKIQLAYIHNDGTIGYYSSIGVVKYTSKPIVNIEKLDPITINMNDLFYTGTYSQEDADITEKVYNYRFDIYDENDNLYETSGNLLHNSFEDVNVYSSRDIYTPTKTLKINKIYHIVYTVITTNNLEESSSKFRIMEKESIEPDIRADVVATLDSDNGYIGIALMGEKDEYGIEYATTGSFVIRRGCSKDNYSEWNTVLSFKLNGLRPSRWLWKDYTVEHGYTYKYALLQYNDYGLYSNRLESNEVYAFFEDAFLYDGERQLKIKYNPKISSFKTNILQSKVDTIGSKYPFIFRNGRVSYKEFPISGLISYHMDELFLFTSEDKILVDNFLSQPTFANIATERIFKQDVLDWLNNGSIKLFRSPTEGSYIVQIMNVSLSPNDTLGRMLHTFNCTAYEVEDYNYLNLLNQGFIKTVNTDDRATRWETQQLHTDSDGVELLKHSPVTSLMISNVVPGTRFLITDSKENKKDVLIGITGLYSIDLDLGLKIKSVKTITEKITEGEITYSYQSNVANVFDTIRNVLIDDTPIRLFMGETNIINEITDIKTDIIQFNFLHFLKRNLANIFVKVITDKEGNTILQEENKYYWDEACKNLVINLEPSYVFLVNESLYCDAGDYHKNNKYYYIDGQNPEVKLNNYSNVFEINGNEVDLTETENYLVKVPPTDIKTFTIGNGLTLECSYHTRIKIYNFEEDSEHDVYRARNEYETALNNYKYWLFNDMSEYENQTFPDEDEYGKYGEFYLEQLNNAKNELFKKELYRIKINETEKDVYYNKKEYYLYLLDKSLKDKEVMNA